MNLEVGKAINLESEGEAWRDIVGYRETGPMSYLREWAGEGLFYRMRHC